MGKERRAPGAATDGRRRGAAPGRRAAAHHAGAHPDPASRLPRGLRGLRRRPPGGATARARPRSRRVGPHVPRTPGRGAPRVRAVAGARPEPDAAARAAGPGALSDDPSLPDDPVGVSRAPRSGTVRPLPGWRPREPHRKRAASTRSPPPSARSDGRAARRIEATEAELHSEADGPHALIAVVLQEPRVREDALLLRGRWKLTWPR